MRPHWPLQCTAVLLFSLLTTPVWCCDSIVSTCPGLACPTTIKLKRYWGQNTNIFPQISKRSIFNFLVEYVRHASWTSKNSPVPTVSPPTRNKSQIVWSSKRGRPPSDLTLSWKLCWVWGLSNISQPLLSPSRWARSHPPESHRVKSSNYQCSNVQAIYFVSAGYFLRILENTTSVFSVIAKTDNYNVYNLLILSGNIWGGPLVSNKHSLSDTGMKTDLLKRPEISFMKINFISTWTISPECSGHKHFSFSLSHGFLDVDWFWIHESWQGHH